MKKLLISVAALGLTVACQSPTSDVTDTSAPAAECASECETGCATACDSADSAECSDQKVCPVTGQVSN